MCFSCQGLFKGKIGCPWQHAVYRKYQGRSCACARVAADYGSLVRDAAKNKTNFHRSGKEGSSRERVTEGEKDTEREGERAWVKTGKEEIASTRHNPSK